MKKTNTLKKNFIQNSLLSRRINLNFLKKYKEIVYKILSTINKPDFSYHVLSKNYKFNFSRKELEKFKKYQNIVLVGMGGSILGIKAICQFLQKKIKKNIYFFDNVDQNKILNLKNELNFNKSLFIIISKSGNTIETLSNLLFLKILKKNKQNVILISEKQNNSINMIAKKFNLFHVEHKNFIGGRFSVLSEVGIVPAYLMGLNIQELRKNFTKYLSISKNSFLMDSTLKLANLLKKKKYKTLVFLNYSPELKEFLYWCQQLIAESLGKKNLGFMPVISNCPKDHHSLLQLYLDGPKDKIFYIFSLDQKKQPKMKTKNILKELKQLNSKSLDQIKNAQKNAVIKTLKKNKIPFREFLIQNKREETIAELFSYFIFETIIIGKLVNINPFNQPAVEKVKIITKKLLS